MFDLPREFVIFDTEFTAWEGSQERDWSGPDEYREIVQIGALKTESEHFAELGAFNIFVRPKRNPLLSEYFIDLTGISQETVDREGVPFAEAMSRLAAWCGGLPLYSFGNDREHLAENCALLGIDFPLATNQFADVREIFRREGIATESYTSGTIARAFGREPNQRPHDALNDARGILDGLKLLAERVSAKQSQP